MWEEVNQYTLTILLGYMTAKFMVALLEYLKLHLSVYVIPLLLIVKESTHIIDNDLSIDLKLM